MTKKEKEKGSVYNRRSKSFRVSGILKANMGIVRNVEIQNNIKERKMRFRIERGK